MRPLLDILPSIILFAALEAVGLSALRLAAAGPENFWTAVTIMTALMAVVAFFLAPLFALAAMATDALSATLGKFFRK